LLWKNKVTVLSLFFLNEVTVFSLILKKRKKNNQTIKVTVLSLIQETNKQIK